MEVHRDQIDQPAAWTVESLGGRQGVELALEHRHLDALDEILRRTRHQSPQAVSRSDFDHPSLNSLLSNILRELLDGRGVVLITGVAPDRYNEEDFERIYFGLGTHWGTAIMQTPSGGRLGHVKHQPGSTHGHQRNAELYPHTDVQDIVGLMCVQNAAIGGLSQLASVPTIHNKILSERPDLLAPLYRGCPFALPYQLDQRHVTAYDIPILSNIEGRISCLYNQNFIEAAARNRSEAIPDDLAEALKLFQKVAMDPDVMLEFMLEPGEILMFNNFSNLHARTNFEDTPERRRHLMRMWLQAPGDRPIAAEYRRFHDFLYYARMAYDLKRELDAVVAPNNRH